MIEVMPRPLRPDIEDGWHHVMNRGIDHGDVFFDDSDRVEIGQRLGDVFERFGIVTHAYCLMDNSLPSPLALSGRRAVGSDAAARLVVHASRQRPARP